jgi:hypothetical protein
MPKKEYDFSPPHSCTSMLNPTVENRCDRIRNMDMNNFITF